MAESLVLSQEAMGKQVQELAIHGDELPTRYIRRDEDDVPVDNTLSFSIPIIDLQWLSSSEEEMEKLRSALKTWGAGAIPELMMNFQAVGHNIPDSQLNDMCKLSKEFFGLPMEEKQRYAIPKDGKKGYLEGYGNDLIVSEDQVLEWSDRLYLLLRPQNEKNLNLWPNNPSCFRKTLNEYHRKVNLTTELLLKNMAKSVGLQENHFLNQVGQCGPTFLRFNYYPPCPKPNLVYGIKPHTDGGAITILLQDDQVEGLQVLKENRWVKVPILPHALLVNVADQVEIMSNGVFKSPKHRVITNSEKQRISLAMFYVPEFEVIEPAAELISESSPRLFKTIKVKDYAEIYFQRTSRGERAIDWVRI